MLGELGTPVRDGVLRDTMETEHVMEQKVS